MNLPVDGREGGVHASSVPGDLPGARPWASPQAPCNWAVAQASSLWAAGAGLRPEGRDSEPRAGRSESTPLGVSGAAAGQPGHTVPVTGGRDTGKTPVPPLRMGGGTGR
jgi:hypothetical protein